MTLLLLWLLCYKGCAIPYLWFNTVLLTTARETNVTLGGYKAIRLTSFKLSTFTESVVAL